MNEMNAAVGRVLAAYEARSQEETKRWHTQERAGFLQERDQYLLAVGPATGRLMNLLAKEAGSKVILEIGTSYGYSTLWLAEAAQATGGRVITLEAHAGKQQYARERMTEAGLAEVIDFRLGDALESIGKLETEVDFVLLDLWKDLYIPCFELFYPKLSPGALVVADNMLFPEASRPHADAYRRHVSAKPGIESILLQVGSGIEVSRRV